MKLRLATTVCALALPAFALAQDASWSPQGVYIFRTDAVQNGQPVCSELWDFGADGRMQPLPSTGDLARAAEHAPGTRLADQVSQYVAPPPPPGTPPEAYLAAVIASRRERDQARLHREAELRRRLTARR